MRTYVDYRGVNDGRVLVKYPISNEHGLVHGIKLGRWKVCKACEQECQDDYREA